MDSSTVVVTASLAGDPMVQAATSGLGTESELTDSFIILRLPFLNVA